MNNRMLTVVGMFVVSVFIGRQMFATTEVIQAQPVFDLTGGSFFLDRLCDWGFLSVI